MNNSGKNILLIVTLVLLCVGVGYLGMKIFSMDKQAASTTSVKLKTPTSVKTTTNISAEEQAKIEAAETCQTSDECVIVSVSDSDKTGKARNNIQCLNKGYLETCINCTSNEELVKKTEEEATCGCVNNLCQFDVFAAK